MNVFEKLRNLLSSESFSRKDFESFKLKNLENGKTSDYGLAYLFARIEKELQTKKIVTKKDVESNPTLFNFTQDSADYKVKPKDKEPPKTKGSKNKLSKLLRSSSKKKSNKLSKSQKATLKRLRGVVERTPDQEKAQELNEARKKQLKSLPTTTNNSIWTVKRK